MTILIMLLIGLTKKSRIGGNEMRVCVMIDQVGPDARYTLVNSEVGRVAVGFKSENAAIEYAEKQEWEVF